jgi:microsomal dipeptidase-like Zn-dependent dipeptidase
MMAAGVAANDGAAPDVAVAIAGNWGDSYGGIGAITDDEAAKELARMQRVQRANEGGPSAEWTVQHVRAPELRGGDRMKRLADALLQRRYSDADVDGSAGTNFVRVFQRAIG